MVLASLALASLALASLALVSLASLALAGGLFGGLKGRRSMLIRAIFHARFWTIAREVELDKMEAVAWGFAFKILLKMADLNRRLTAP